MEWEWYVAQKIRNERAHLVDTELDWRIVGCWIKRSLKVSDESIQANLYLKTFKKGTVRVYEYCTD
jgi:hypothetical protein